MRHRINGCIDLAETRLDFCPIAFGNWLVERVVFVIGDGSVRLFEGCCLPASFQGSPSARRRAPAGERNNQTFKQAL